MSLFHRGCDERLWRFYPGIPPLRSVIPGFRQGAQYSSIVFCPLSSDFSHFSFQLPTFSFRVSQRIMSSMSTQNGEIVSINIGPGGIPKQPVERCNVTFTGLENDWHNHEKHRSPNVAVSFLDIEDLDDFVNEGFEVYPGAMAENVTVRGMNVDALEVGDRLRFPSGLEVEITKRRRPCYVLDPISPDMKTKCVGRCGMMAKVLTPGELRVGDVIEVVAAERIGKS